MKMRYITKRYNNISDCRRVKPGEQLFLFSLTVSNQLEAGRINVRRLTNFKKVLKRIVGSEKDYDGYIYYPLDRFKTLGDLASQIHYCSDRWCAGRAASVIAAVDKALQGELTKG